MMDLALPLACGVAGAVVGTMARIPNGTLLGPIVAVAALQLAGGYTVTTAEPLAIAGQLLIGAAIGSSLDGRILASFRRIAVPGAVAVTGMLAGGALVGVLFLNLTDIPPAAALFGAMPGGASEMAAATLAFGPDGATVVAIHLTRSIVLIAVLPVVLTSILKALEHRAATLAERTTDASREGRNR